MNRLESFKAKAEDTIFCKGDPSTYFYVIVRGSVEISNWADGQPNKTLTIGNCFGDLGIYNKTTRSATATALEDCELVGLPNQNFLKISLELSKRAQNDVFR
jgi:CRP-like cAMP-binding protein